MKVESHVALRFFQESLKILLSEIINDLIKIRIKVVGLQTEKGFYTERVYKNMGFKEFMIGKAYSE